ncbi:MAG: caspase family protein [Sphingobacteriaceae bacterium]|nr:caspase family protein [Sphingobacteriaceae bacterium]
MSIYNIQKRKFTKLIKKTGYATTSGFMNNEFYYCDNASLYIINLKTLAEEKYSGMYSLAALPQYQMINFTDHLVFVPESGKYKIVNRKTKEVEYENTAWNLNVRVIISPDEKNVFTTGVVKTKKIFGGNEVEMDMNAVIRIDMAKKAIVSHYAETYYPYDFVMRDNGKSIGIWYVKYDIEHYNDSLKEALYSVYDIETAKVISTKTLTQSKEIITNHHTSENGRYFAMDNYLGNSLKIFNESGDMIMDIGELKIPMPKLFFNESLDRLIITTYQNPLATFVDLKTRKIIGQLVNANDDQYFLVTSDLHYLGSKDFIKNIRFKYQSEIFSFEQFDAKLNQPHKVLKAFGCKDTVLIKAYETAFLKRMKLLGIKAEENLNFKSFPTILSLKMEDDKPNFVKFSISASKGKAKLSDLEVYNNATLVYSEKISDDQKNKFDKTLVIETSSGINRYEFIIKDESGYESPRITRFYNNTTVVKPNLYLVVIASEKFKNSKYNLSYAVKDATDMANTMANSKSFGKTEIKKVFNQSFTVDSMANLNSFFSKATINDVVMVFFAGHGYLDDDLTYYFPTYYTDFTDPKINSVTYKTFEKLFQGMKPIRKLMFIDACFSGEVDEETIFNTEDEESGKDTTRSAKTIYSTFAQSTALEMSKTIFSDLRQNSGATIISSAGGTEAAFEGEKWNNGLFTYCLLQGISKTKADKNFDKKVMLSELQRFVADEVYRLSDGKQSPTYRMENTALDYELWEY